MRSRGSKTWFSILMVLALLAAPAVWGKTITEEFTNPDETNIFVQNIETIMVGTLETGYSWGAWVPQDASNSRIFFNDGIMLRFNRGNNEFHGNMPWAYAYCIFDPTGGNGSEFQDFVELMHMGGSIQIDVIKGATDQQIQILIRDKAGHWFLSDEIFDVDPAGDTILITDLQNMTWQQVSEDAGSPGEDMNLMAGGADNKPGTIEGFLTPGVPDLSEVTGGGIMVAGSTGTNTTFDIDRIIWSPGRLPASGPEITLSASEVYVGATIPGGGVRTKTLTISNTGLVGSALPVSLDVSELSGVILKSAKKNNVDVPAPYSTTVLQGTETLVLTFEYTPPAAADIASESITINHGDSRPETPPFIIPIYAAAMDLPSGVLFHLDASDMDADGIMDSDQGAASFTEGASVSQWSDGSLNNFHVTNSSGDDTLPIYHENVINGLPVVAFDGGDFLSRDDALGFTGNPAATVIIVGRDTPAYSRFMQIGEANGTNLQVIAFTSDAGYRYNDGNALFDQGMMDDDISVGVYRFAANQNLINREFAKNGEWATLASNTNGTAFVDFTPAALLNTRIGGGISNTGGNSNMLDGDISEIIIYDREMTDGEVNEIGFYLEMKYGIETSYHLSGPQLGLSVEKIQFGALTPGAAARTKKLTVENTGLTGSSLDVSIDVSGLSGVTVKSVTVNSVPLDAPYTASLSKADGDVLEMVLEYAPGQHGDVYTESVIITSNDKEAQVATIPINAATMSFPVAIKGRLMHLDAADVDADGVQDLEQAVAPVADGATLETWSDLGPQGNDVTNATAGEQPTYLASGKDGLPVLTFSGGQELNRPDSLGFVGDPAWTVFTVINAVDQGTDSRILTVGPATGGNQLIFAVSTDGAYRYNNGNAVFQDDLYTTQGIGMFRHHEGATIADREFWKNGVSGPLLTSSNPDDVPSIPATGDRMTIVGRSRNASGTPSNALNGTELAELIVFDRYLNEAEHKEIGYYLAVKYGITSVYPPPAPRVGAVPSPVDFRSPEPDSGRRTEVLTLTNAGYGETPLQIDSLGKGSLGDFDIDGMVFNGQVITEGDFPVTLGSTATLEVTIGFDPVIVGQFTGTIDVVSNDSDSPTVVPLKVRVRTIVKPPVVDGLELLFDASDIYGLADGDPVVILEDLAGNGHDATRIISDYLPTYKENIINGKPVLRFDGVNDSIIFERVDDVRTVFLVMNESAPVSAGIKPILGDTNASAPYFHRGAVETNSIFNGVQYTAPQVSQGAFYLNGTPSDFNTIPVPETMSILTVVTTDDAETDMIGSDRFYTTRHIGADYAEVIIYNRALSPFELNRVGWYLQQKYGLAGSYTLPVAGPYIFADPLSVDFGSLDPDAAPRTRTVLISDNGFGATPLTFTSIVTTNPNFSIIRAEHTTLGLIADPYATSISGDAQEKLLVTIAFTPTVEATYSENLTINSNGTGMTELHIPLLARTRPTLPPVTDGLTLHLDAEAINGGVDNAPVKTWIDNSGKDNHAIQNAYTDRPLYIAAGINSKPTLRFATENAEMVVKDRVASFAVGAVTSFIVFQTNDPGGQLLSWQDSDRTWEAGEWGMWLGDGTPTETVNALTPATASNSNAYVVSGEPITAFDPHSLTYTFDLEEGVGSAKLFVDGAEPGSYAQNNFHGRNSEPAGTQLYIGRSHRFGTLTNMSGDISEVIVYNRKLTTSERTQVGHYLQTKYGLAGSLQSGQAIEVTPSAVDFGLLPIGVAAQTRTVEIRNAGFGSPLSIQSIAIDAPFTPLSVTLNGAPLTDPYPASLNGEAGDVMVVTVSYNPVAEGVFSGNLTITSDAPGASPLMIPLLAQPSNWSNRDIGDVAAVGSAIVTPDTITINASGADIWNLEDEFHFVYKSLTGNGSIVAQVSGFTTETNAWMKYGVMMRESLAPGSKFANSVMSAQNGAAFQYRDEYLTNAARIADTLAGVMVPYWVRMERTGNVFTASASVDGVDWFVFDPPQTIEMPERIYIGLCATSHNDGVVATGSFTDVTTTGNVGPAPLTEVVYVDKSARGGNDGTSWANAYTTIQAGIDSAEGGFGGEVWIKKGLYTITNGLRPRDNVSILGGFQGDETEASARNPGLNPVIVNMDMVNRRHFYMLPWRSSNVTIDGLVLIKGNRTGTTTNVDDSGAVVRLFNGGKGNVLRNCFMIDNTVLRNGAGVALHGGAELLIENCVFAGNWKGNAGEYGSAIYTEGNSKATIINCVFSGNSGVNGMLTFDAGDRTIDIINCTFADNFNSGEGLVHALSGQVNLVNNIFASNTQKDLLFGTQDGDAIINRDATLIFGNAIVAEKGGAVVGVADIESDPMFVHGATGVWTSVLTSGPLTILTAEDAPFMGVGAVTGKLINPAVTQPLQSLIVANTGSQVTIVGGGFGAKVGNTFQVIDYRLAEGSPAIDTASTSTVTPATDLNGIVRTIGAGADLGAYEYVPASAASADVLTIVGTDMTAMPAPTGVTSLYALACNITSGTDVTIDGVTVTLTGAADGDIESVRLYLDTDTNGMITEVDSLIAQGAVTSGSAVLVFASPRVVTAPYRTDWLLATQFNAQAIGKSFTFTINEADWSAPSVKESVTQIPEPLVATITAARDTLTVIGAATSGSNGTGLNTVMSLSASVTAGQLVVIDGVSVSITGGAANDIEQVQFYSDTDNDGALSLGDVQMASGPLLASTAQLRFDAPVTFTGGIDTANWLVVVRFNGSAKGKSFTVTVDELDWMLNEELGGTDDVVLSAPTNPLTAIVTPAVPSHAMKISFPGYDRDETLADFPVLIHLSDTAIPGFYASLAGTNGADLRFTTNDRMTELPYEVEKWDATGTSALWVRVPQFSGTSSIWAFWGDSSATVAPAYTTDGSAWNENYEAVWHLNGDAPNDSTAYGRDGVNSGAVAVPGMIGEAQDFDGDQSVITIPTYNGIAGTVSRSQMAWIKSSSEGDHVIMRWGQNTASQKWTFRTQLSDGLGRIRMEVNGGYHVGTTNLADDEWHHVAAVLTNDGSPNVNEIRLYVDGKEEVYSAASGQSINTVANRTVTIGNDDSSRPFLGSIDEVRIASTDYSGNWMYATYANVAVPGFVAFGTVSTTASPVPIAEAGLNIEIMAGHTGVLNGTGSTLNVGYNWSMVSFDPASSLAGVTFVSPDQMITSADFSTEILGVYTMSITVSNGLSSSADTMTVTVVNDSPSVDAGLDRWYLGTDGGLVRLAGLAPDFYPAGDPVATVWTMSDNTSLTFAQGAETDLDPIVQLPTEVGAQTTLRLTATDSLSAVSFDEITFWSVAAPRIYVDAAAGGDGSGLDWDNAIKTVAEGVVKAGQFGMPEVWVKAGTYAEMFTLPSGVSVYGGFAGTETVLADRDLLVNETILNGATAAAGQPAKHVVVMDGIVDARLDGFTIKGANANGADADSNGGGVYCINLDTSSVIANIDFQNNKASAGGGAILCETASPLISACMFTGNSALVSGGAIACLTGSNPSIINCVFSANTATTAGGAIASIESKPEIINCTFNANTATFGGAVFCWQNSDPDVTNCIFKDNVGHAIYEFDTPSDARVRYCLFFGNTTEVINTPGSYYDFSGDGATTTSYISAAGINAGVTGASDNIDGDPLFVSATDFHLQDGSPAIDMAGGAGQGAPPTDKDGTIRPVDIPDVGVRSYDIGAYEVKTSQDISVLVTAIDFGDQFIDAGPSAPESLTIANNGTGVVSFIGEGIVVGGADAAEFTITTATLDTSDMAAGEVRVLQILFDPASLGPKTADLIITSNDPNETTITVTLTGNGTEPPTPTPTGLDLVDEDDTGSVTTDNLTKNTTALTITGQAAADTVVELYEGATFLTSGTAAAFAMPGLDIDLAAGVHSITATAKAADKDASPASLPLSITVDVVAPTVTAITPLTSGPTGSSTLAFRVEFSEDVIGFEEPGDVLVILDGTATSTDVTIQRNTGRNYTVTIGGVSGLGSVAILVKGDSCEDKAGNPLPADSAPSAAIEVDPDAGVFYTLDVNAENGTAVRTPDMRSYAPNEIVSVQATAATDYIFSGWTGDVEAGTENDNPISITMTGNKTITANFIKEGVEVYELTVVADNGSVTRSPEALNYEEGTTVTLSATPDTGYVFDSWTGDVISDEASVVVTMDADKSVTANFIQLAVYTLGVNATNGSVAIDPSGTTFTVNTAVTLTATPDEGFHFVNWTGSVPTGEAEANPLGLVMDSDKLVTALFEADAPATVTLTIVAEDGSVLELPQGPVYVVGTTVTVTATPAEGYVFTEWTSVEAEITTDTNPLEFLIDMDTTLTAVFTALPVYSLTIDPANGLVDISPEGTTFTVGASVMLTATAPEGYDFTGWTGDVPMGEEMTNPITVMMDADRSIAATFAIQTFTLDVAATGGSVNITPDQPTYDYGTTVGLIITPDANFHFTGWVGADVPSGHEMDTELVLTMTADKSVEAMFAIDTFALTLTAGDGGTVAATPSQTAYDYGTQVGMTATPDEGYAFVVWEGDVVAGQEEANPTTVTMDADKSLTATFRALPAAGDYKVTYKNCTVNVDAEGNMAITGTTDKSTIKIAKLKKPPKSTEPKAGKFFYMMGARVIPELTIPGAFGKFSSDLEIWSLVGGGAVKSITTKKSNIAWIEVQSIGSIKMTMLADATQGETAALSVLINGPGKALSATFNGIVVENFTSNQEVKKMLVASKAFKTATKAKTYSLGGIGALARVVAQAAGETNVPVENDSLLSAPLITSLSGKGAPITPDTIIGRLKKIAVQGGSFKTATVVKVEADLVVRRLISSQPIKSISCKAKKVSGQPVGGRIGVQGDSSIMRIQAAGDISTISGQDISAIIWAGFSGDPAAATHTGLIKKITAKGNLEGEAHMKSDPKSPKIKATNQTGFTVVTQ